MRPSPGRLSPTAGSVVRSTGSTPVDRLGAPRRAEALLSASRKPRGDRVAYFYLALPFLMFAVFVLYPLMRTVWFSFYEWDGVSAATWTGLANYSTELGDDNLRAALAHSTLFIVTFCLIPVVLGLALAAILGRRQLWGVTFFRVVLFLPQVIATVVIGVAWRWMYSDDGTLNQLLGFVGIHTQRAWLGDFTWALPFIGLIGTWVMTGLCMVLFLAGIGKIDENLYDAARVDGAGALREFRTVTLPGLRGELSVAVTITVIAALRSFDLVYVTTGGGPGFSTIVPGTEIYRLAFRDGEVGQACAVAVLLTALIFAVVLVVTRLLREKQ